MAGDLDDPSGLSGLHALIERGASGVVHDSREVTPGVLFACLRGEHADGHTFAAAALAAGAAAVLVDHPLDGVDPDRQLVVDDTRLRLGPIASVLAGEPSGQLLTVGITGTNGKTTTAALVAATLEATGRPTGVVGTLHGPRTTPEAPELQATLRGFVDRGDRAAVLEVSSHALALHRVDGTRFDAVVFTNLGHDHLDLHGSYEEYFRAKASLFDARFALLGVVNADDIHGRLIADAASGGPMTIVTFGAADITDVRVGATRHSYRWHGIEVTVPLGGRFNVWNSLAALTTAHALGIDRAVAAEALASVPPVPGRFDVVDTPAARERGVTVIVDYAHTPDGLELVLASARDAVSEGGSVTVVFGCGGDRDRAKRPEMGAVAARSADRIVVTSDNPRREPPMAIIDDIVAGVDPGSLDRVVAVVDRSDAIGLAIGSARPGDVVVIAGKGHERTQEFADGTIEFDDRAVARAHLEDAP